MLIQIPIMIHFDAADLLNLRHAADHRVFTLRYDTNPDSVRPTEWCNHYPPRDNAYWIADEQGVFFDLFTAKADKTITKRATDDPETYQATEAA